ncbi:hypothetical protein DUNSADRAFT_14111 [Dunaliella salina]|uniref:DNA replication complex GINS protein SLD5 n=1 Tax=Dunaliella salina TaxID=3046 RepID=A0ABQ7G7Z0_DUNSA|nr:hypothetical protein DUNSADRAFT_14111 [Dunaliella salina]|eukprot:KAF5830729.1 hypothetical protein DUNSADRAFT_14111 [Dunaliella salina]
MDPSQATPVPDESASAPPPSGDIELLIQATLNEKNAPEILEFKQDVVDRLQGALSAQEEYVEALESDMCQELRRMVLSLENKRVRYLLKLYHRTRLQKIEKFAASIVADEQYQDRLSESEMQYCRDYFVLLGRHFHGMVLDHLPDDFRPLVKLTKLSTHDDLILRPKLNTHVFVKAVDNCGSVLLNEDLVLDVTQNDLFIMRYEPMAHLVRTGQVVLI